MQIDEAFEVAEAYSVKQVNLALQSGWKLLAVTAVSDPHGGTQIVSCYVLGKKKPATPMPAIDPSALR